MLEAHPRTYDIPAFCERYKISRAKAYLMWEVGVGPRRIRIGRRVYITYEDAEEWYLGHRVVEA